MINIFIVCYNESVLLPHTIAHYKKNFPDCNITIYDNYSTDNSVEIAKNLGCNCIYWDTNNITDEYKLRDLKNTCWKYITDGWIIMIDMDEWLCVTEYELNQEQMLGTTILNINGIDMIGQSKDIDLLDIDLNSINKYIDNEFESKKLCFLANDIKEMNYSFGAHACEPFGNVKYSSRLYYNKHMVSLGLLFLEDKMIKRYKRSIEMQKIGMDTHYTDNIDYIRNKYYIMLSQSKTLT